MLEEWAIECSEIGLNVHAWLALDTVASSLPFVPPEGVKSVFLLGSTGSAFWERFQHHLKVHPQWGQQPDPLDRFTRWALEHWSVRWSSTLGIDRILYSFEGPPWIDFVQWAKYAGWGESGPLGLSVHPQFGPWVGLRAAVLTSFVPDAYAMPLTHSVCLECSAPCIQNCPAGAVMRTHWDVHTCSSHRKKGECSTNCVARWSCPVGESYRYSTEQMAFHMCHAYKLLCST